MRKFETLVYRLINVIGRYHSSQTRIAYADDTLNNLSAEDLQIKLQELIEQIPKRTKTEYDERRPLLEFFLRTIKLTYPIVKKEGLLSQDEINILQKALVNMVIISNDLLTKYKSEYVVGMIEDRPFQLIGCKADAWSYCRSGGFISSLLLNEPFHFINQDTAKVTTKINRWIMLDQAPLMIEYLQKELTQLVSQIRILEFDIRNFAQYQQQSEHKMELLQQELSEKNSMVTSLTKQCEKTVQKLQSLEQSVATDKSLNKNLQEEMRVQSARIEALTLDVTAKETQYSIAQQKNAELEYKLASLEKTLSEKDATILSLTEQNQTLSVEAASLNDLVKEMNKESELLAETAISPTPPNTPSIQKINTMPLHFFPGIFSLQRAASEKNTAPPLQITYPDENTSSLLG